MIGVFADPYPDELFYSICARTCKRAGYSGQRTALHDLFGRGTVVTSVTLPSHLDDLVARLPPESLYTSDYFIAEHTLLPFFHPFLPSERSRRLRQYMCGPGGGTLYMLSGITTSPVPLPEWLRFCPVCVVEDKSRYGECYWHRIHQISGIDICPLHEVYLQESDVRAKNKKRRHEFISAEVAIRWTEQQQSHTQSPYHQIFLALARDAAFLLHQHNLSQELAGLTHRYRKLLYERDLATYGGSVNGDLFLHRFKSYYPPQLLQFLHCELDEQIRRTWLHRLVHSRKEAQHPLHHLLLIHFLGYTVENFFGISVEDQPFGDGPWPCLNPVCHQYRQLCIRECRIVYSQNISGKPIGTFVCTCGFAYSRTGPDATGNNQFHLSKIKAFGTLWETRLQMLWGEEKVSLRAIARQLGVDYHTVKDQAVRIGLPLSRPGGTLLQQKRPKLAEHSREQGNDPAILETKRATWLAVMQAHPGVGVRILRNKESGLYSWLYRNDKMWLSAHTPLCKKRKLPHYRVDWEARDLELADKVRIAVLRLKDLPGHPVRITISSIGREIGQLSLLQRSMDKLPRTTEVLKEVVETHETFAVRRVWWAVTAFSQEHIHPERWQIIQRAGVWRMAASPEVKNALDTTMQILRGECKV